jgi:hypothetical protein
MHRPFLSLVACVTVIACARSNPSVEAPAPAPAAASAVPDTVILRAESPVRASASGPLREFRGAYTRGFEASWFVPCDAPMGDTLWWVTLTEDARIQRDSMLKAMTGTRTGALAVRWRGMVGERMPAGHMGRGTRYLLVTEILEIRALPGEGACLPGARSS